MTSATRRCASCEHSRRTARCVVLGDPGCRTNGRVQRERQRRLRRVSGCVTKASECHAWDKKRRCLLVGVRCERGTTLSSFASERWPVDTAGNEHSAPLRKVGFRHAVYVCRYAVFLVYIGYEHRCRVHRVIASLCGDVCSKYRERGR